MKNTSKDEKASSAGEPRARKDDLIVKEMPDEVLIYDLLSDKAHCLNRTAAMVWNRCDGRTSPAAIASRLKRELNVAVDERVVWLALNQLSKNNLLEEKIVLPSVMVGMNRREVIRALGVAAVLAAPIVTSIVAPTPAHAQSGPISCCSGTDCPSGICTGAGPGCDPPGTCQT